MFDLLSTLLQQQNILHHVNQGITICSVRDQLAGVDLVKNILYTVADRKTALYLSGGRTPKELYGQLAKEEILSPGAVGMVDERFGAKWHERSNEKMMKETGLLRYLEMRNIPFYPMLHKSPQPPLGKGGDGYLPPSLEGGGPQAGGFLAREETAEAYDEKIRSLNAIFQRSVALLGIGSDGHTAGIAGNRGERGDTGDKGDRGFRNPLFDKDSQYQLVSEFNDENGMFKERVTMTFLGLSMMDLLVVLVFGDDKKEALEWMFDSGSEEEIPARFYKRPDIASKTIIITDQRI